MELQAGDPVRGMLVGFGLWKRGDLESRGHKHLDLTGSVAVGTNIAQRLSGTMASGSELRCRQDGLA